jgi:hypothetical protein
MLCRLAYIFDVYYFLRKLTTFYLGFMQVEIKRHILLTWSQIKLDLRTFNAVDPKISNITEIQLMFHEISLPVAEQRHKHGIPIMR